jgi:hypothetical protein
MALVPANGLRRASFLSKFRRSCAHAGPMDAILTGTGSAAAIGASWVLAIYVLGVVSNG